mmetsp:Transcript_17153/g.35391  ORF Transcript_17153/g.35391 Transcript_17153/m.35391 type:complete len:229 (+) Transcript_17153:67-753(+)
MKRRGTGWLLQARLKIPKAICTLFIVGVRIGICLLQPHNNGLGFATKGGTGFLVNGVESVLGSSIFGPFNDCFFLEDIFVIELLDHDREVLWLFRRQKLEGGNQMAFDDLVAVCKLRDDRSVLFNFLILEELRSDRGPHKNLNPVVSLERRSHLLVCNDINDVIDRSIWIPIEIVSSSFNSKNHGAIIINTSFGNNFVFVRIGSKVVFLFAFENSLKIVIIFFSTILG